METKTRVLIADSNEDFRGLMTELLRNEEDMEPVGCAADGIDALALTAEYRPDIIVMDIVLRNLDGLEVLRRLPEACPDTKALVVSGFYNDKVIADCAAAGACYFIPKPCDASTLLGRIRQIRAYSGKSVLTKSPVPQTSRGEASLEAMVTDIIHEIGVPAPLR